MPSGQFIKGPHEIEKYINWPITEKIEYSVGYIYE